MTNAALNTSNQKLSKEEIREQIKEKQDVILEQKTFQISAQKDLINKAENSSFLDIWINHKENARGERLDIIRIRNSEHNISQRQKEVQNLNKELLLRFPEAIVKQDALSPNQEQITNCLTHFNSIVEKLKLIDKLKKANKKGAVTDEFITYGKELARELEELVDNKIILSDLQEAQKQISVLISQNSFQQELETINHALKAFNQLLTHDQTRQLIAQLNDRSLFRSDSFENFFYNDFLPIANSIAVGVGLSVLTGGAFSGVVLATALRTAMFRGGLSLLAQGVGGVLGNEIAKEVLYNANNSSLLGHDTNKANYSNRSLLGAYLFETKIGGKEIDQGEIISNYSTNALLSAAGSGATQVAGKGLGVCLGFFRYRLDKFASKIYQPLSKEIILPFLPKATAKLVLPIKPDTKTEIWKNVLEEYLDETKEALVEQTAALTGSQLQEKGIKLPGFNIPLVSLPAALLIALGRSGKYKSLNDPLNYLTRKSSLSDIEQVWDNYQQILPPGDVATLVNKYYHAYRQKNYNEKSSSNSRSKENYNPQLFFETASFLKDNLRQLSAAQIATLASDYYFLNLKHKSFYQSLTAYFLGNFSEFSDSQKARILKAITATENQILLEVTLIFFENNVTELAPKSLLAIELFRAYQISGMEMPENFKEAVAPILQRRKYENADKSHFEQKVAKFFEQFGIIPENQIHTLGYELDLILYLGQRRIVVECDGDIFHYIDGIPEHGLYAKDRVKDSLLLKNSYEILRIPLSLWDECHTETKKIKLFIDQLGYHDNPEKFFSDLAITNITQMLCQALDADYQPAETSQIKKDCLWIIEEIEQILPNERTPFETTLLIELTSLNQCLDLLFALSDSRDFAETRDKLTALQKQVLQINPERIYSDIRFLTLLDYLTLVVQSEGTFFASRPISTPRLFIKQSQAVNAALSNSDEGLQIIKQQFFASLPNNDSPSLLDFNAAYQISLLEMLSVINIQTENQLFLRDEIMEAALLSKSDHIRAYAQILVNAHTIPESQRENQRKETREYLQILHDYFNFRRTGLKLKADRRQKPMTSPGLPAPKNAGIAERYQKRFVETGELENIFYTKEIDLAEIELIFGKTYRQQVEREQELKSMVISDTERPILHRRRHGDKKIDAFCFVGKEIQKGDNIYNIRLLNCVNQYTQRNLIEAILFRYSKHVLAAGDSMPIVFSKQELQKMFKNPEQTIKDALEIINNQHEFSVETIEGLASDGSSCTYQYFIPKQKSVDKAFLQP